VEALFVLSRSGVLEESTWEFPRGKQDPCILARCMGYREPDVSQARFRLLGDWHAVRDEVQARCQERLLSGQGESSGG